MSRRARRRRPPGPVGSSRTLCRPEIAYVSLPELLTPSPGTLHLALDERPGCPRDVEALRGSGDVEPELPQTLLGPMSGRAGHARLVDPSVERGGRGVPGPSRGRPQPLAEPVPFGHDMSVRLPDCIFSCAGPAHPERVGRPT